MLGMNNIFVVQNEGEALFSARKSDFEKPYINQQVASSIDHSNIGYKFGGSDAASPTKEDLFMSTKVLKQGNLIDLPGQNQGSPEVMDSSGLLLYKRNTDNQMLNLLNYDQSTDLASDNKLCVDLFSLRILSLLVCRGDVRDKAQCLLNIIIGTKSIINKTNNNNSTADPSSTQNNSSS